VPLELVGRPRGVVLVENNETFEHLLALADHELVVLWVPCGPPPAEAELARRLHELEPALRFQACFDLDPAGIRIARLIEEKAAVALEPTGMGVELLAGAEQHLDLNRWDCDHLARGPAWAGICEPLRAALAAAPIKVEQETLERRLYEHVLKAATNAAALV
jgi:hypothetical protein